MAWDPPVSRRLSEFLAAVSPATLAAFDADGTLWNRDVGEAFLRHAGEAGFLLKWKKGGAVWDEYERRLATGDLAFAFELCVTAFEGLFDAEVAQLAREFVDPQWSAHVFPEMRELVRSLHKAEAEVWVVSASPCWCVVPGAALLGVPQNRVIAARPALGANGVVGSALAAPLPAFENKVTQLLAAARRGPHLAAGNSEYDFALLESARALALLVNPPAGEAWRTRKNGASWLVQALSMPVTSKREEPGA